MNLEQMQSAWQSLERSFEHQHHATDFLVRERRFGAMRSRLHTFAWAHVAQIAIGVALVALGVAVWSRNGVAAVPFAIGVVVHAFGLVNIAWAVATIAHVTSIDYSAPVLAIQQRLAAIARFEAIGVLVCALPWWFMWALVVAAAFSLGGASFDEGSLSAWLATSIGVGVVGFIATWFGYLWARRSGRAALAATLRRLVVGASLRRAHDEIDALRRFESEG